MGKRELKKKNKKKKIVLLVLIIVVVILAAIAIAGYAIFNHYYSLMNYEEASGDTWESVAVEEEVEEVDESDELSDLEEVTEEELEQIESDLEENLEAMQETSSLYTDNSFDILLIGVDSRSDSNTGRSDCMILISVNKDTKAITMTSFLRDIYCTIPGYGNNRLNAAFAYGGPDLLESTLEANFGITVDRYMVVNFYSVAGLIDAVGGVDIEVTAEEIEVMNSYIASQNTLFGYEEGTDLIDEADEGLLHLNGNQALAYARVRYVGTDFARTGRQREVIEQVIGLAADMSMSEMLDLVEEFLPEVTTDLTQADFASLILMALDIGSYSINSFSIPISGSWSNARISGMAVLVIDFQENFEYWYEIVNG